MVTRKLYTEGNYIVLENPKGEREFYYPASQTIGQVKGDVFTIGKLNNSGYLSYPLEEIVDENNAAFTEESLNTFVSEKTGFKGGAADTPPVDVAQIQADLDIVEARAGDNTTAINALEPRVAQNESDTTTNASGISDNTNLINALEPRVAQNESDIANNSTAISNNAISIGDNTSNISSNSAEITDLETTVGFIRSNLNDFGTRITNNEAGILTNASNITDNTNKVDTNTTTINNIINEIAVLRAEKVTTVTGDGIDNTEPNDPVFNINEVIKTIDVVVPPNGELVTDVEMEDLLKAIYRDITLTLSTRVGVEDVESVSSPAIAALLINNNNSDDCYNDAKVGTTNLAFPAVDLGMQTDVYRVRLHWRSIFQEYATDFKIQGSNDLTNWTDVSVGLSASGISSRQQNYNLFGSFRYWRVFCIQGQSPDYLSISEMRMYDGGAVKYYPCSVGNNPYYINENNKVVFTNSTGFPLNVKYTYKIHTPV